MVVELPDATRSRAFECDVLEVCTSTGNDVEVMSIESEQHFELVVSVRRDAKT